MFNTVGFIFLLLWSSVLGENCLTHNFESGFGYVFHSNSSICNNGQPWQLANYTSIDIEGAPDGSTYFIEPITALTCESTNLFEIDEGTLEVNFYMKSKSLGDFLSVFVSEIINDQEVIYESASFSQITPGYRDGWNVLRINFVRSFRGYISFMGEQSDDSIVLIDSFRYYAQDYEADCQIYDNNEINISTTEYGLVETITESTADPNLELEITTTPTTYITHPHTENEFSTVPEVGTTDSDSISSTASPVDVEKCVTYNFDKDFDSLFTHKNDLCTDFDMWALNNYTSNGIDPDNANGRSYLSPNEDLSCIAAFPIRMSPNGVVEVNVYIDPASDLDYIIVLVKNIVQGSVDTVAGSYIYEPSVSSFVRGWNVLRVNVMNLRSFDGYLILLGAASEGSTVLVDSFRYIPPWASPDDEECQIH